MAATPHASAFSLTLSGGGGNTSPGSEGLRGGQASGGNGNGGNGGASFQAAATHSSLHASASAASSAAASSRQVMSQQLPSYFERANKEPELLVGKLIAESVHQTVKTTILDSLTLRTFHSPSGRQKLHAPPIRHRTIVEILVLLDQLAKKQNERREMETHDEEKSTRGREGEDDDEAAPASTSEYFALRAPEKELENRLMWLVAAFARLVALGEDDRDEMTSSDEMQNLPLGTRYHMPSVLLAKWLVADPQSLDMNDEDIGIIDKYLQGAPLNGLAVERPISPWIRHYLLESIALDMSWRVKLHCTTQSENTLVWKQTCPIAKLALDTAWNEEKREEEEETPMAGERGDAMEERSGAVKGVQMDALCLLARAGERRANLHASSIHINVMQELRKSFSGSTTRHVYRALRSCAVPELVRDMVHHIDSARERKRFEYNSTMALAQVSTLPDDDIHRPHKQKACVTLQSLVIETRNFPMHDEMRSTALWGLGKLGSEMPTTTILDELTDMNPQVQRSAARALERIWGIKRAITRVMEVAKKSGRDSWTHYGRALQWMDDRAKLVETLNDEVVSQTDHETQECAKTLLAEIGGFSAISKLQIKNQAAEEFRKHIREEEASMRQIFFKAIEDAKAGFIVARNMDMAVFAIGVALLIVSAILAISSDGSLTSWASSGTSGGLGVLGIIYSTVIAKPRRQVEVSIDHLMHLQATFLGFLRQLHHVEQVYSRRMLDEENIPIDDVRAYGTMLERAIDRAVQSVKTASSYAPSADMSTTMLTSTSRASPNSDVESAMDVVERGDVRGQFAVRIGRRMVKKGGEFLTKEGVKLDANTPLVNHGASLEDVIKAISRAAKAHLASGGAAQGSRLKRLSTMMMSVNRVASLPESAPAGEDDNTVAVEPV